MEKIVFTNGCFDIIHPGHIDLLKKARGLGTKLIVGINSDASVRKIKGKPRPFISERERAETLKELRFVDEVRVFDELTPEKLIKEIKPNVLVKGGDWKEDEIIGADFVRENGGEVFSIPLKEGYSTSDLVETIRQNGKTDESRRRDTAKSKNIIEASISEHIRIFKDILKDEIKNIETCGEILHDTLKNGNKILICGNGGSAADSQHLAAEFVGRFETERMALPAIALTTDTSSLTALTNDYDFKRVFSRQIEALARKGDLLIAISTSGNSPNVIAAAMSARKNGCKILGLTGASGKKLASLCDACILIPATRTARIQEAHIVVGHIWCEIIDKRFASLIEKNAP